MERMLANLSLDEALEILNTNQDHPSRFQEKEALVLARIRIAQEEIGTALALIEALLEDYTKKSPAHNRQSFPNRSTDIRYLLDPLSSQEERVLRLLAAGLTNPEIAQELVLSVNTVKTHVKSVYRKLNVNSRSAAREAARSLDLHF